VDDCGHDKDIKKKGEFMVRIDSMIGNICE
jgi:hypothetical protein